MTELEIAASSEVLSSQWIGFGSKVKEFEAELSKVRRLPNMTMVDSGSNALFMAVKLLDLPVGSEIILPSFTWVSCAQAVLLAGCVPIFCDVDYDSMNVRAQDIEPLITSKTGAVMVVHYAGLPVDLVPILAFGIPVIEDAAHAIASDVNGKACGTLGDIGIYSFDSVKNLAVGEGGGLVAKNVEIVERARRLRYCGIGKSGFESAATNSNGRWWEYDISEPFIKMLPTNIAAAIGLVQLDRLTALQCRREEIWNFYNSVFESADLISTPVNAPPGYTHSYFTYCIRVPKRDDLAKYLLANDVYSTLRYHPLHMNSLYQQTSKRLPNTQKLNEVALSIPLHPRMSNHEMETVAELVLAFYG
ncbi:DegT/DnrJ/EryC1/StrS family aminotransferase [bacterium]|nr:DegT/DnrJ/EryC1/StrS family aminotransferase [bacterium]